MSTLHVVIGSGPVGTTLTRQLADAGQTVRVVTRSGRGLDHPLVTKVAADISTTAQAVSACAGASVVYNAANPAYTQWARDFPPIQAGAIAGAAAAGAVLVVTENLYMYGPSTTPITEAHGFDSPARKGKLRAAMTNDLFAAHRAGTVRATAVRPADYVGPLVVDSHLGERFIPAILNGKAARVIGDPRAPHTFSYVPDVARAMVTLGSDERAWGRAWHAPMLPARSFIDLAQAIGTLAGTTGKVQVMPNWALTALSKVVPILREVAEMRYQVDAPYLIDASAIASTFGLTATSWDEVLAATVSWYQAHRAAA